MTTPAMTTLRLGEHLLGFYEGRDRPNGEAVDSWVLDGALSLGICSYALIDGLEAIVYDTHVSVERGRTIRATLEQLGVRRIRVVLSHWHLDHVAGTEAFADCEVIANRRTADLLAEHRTAIEAGTFDGPPAIAPLILPTTVFDDAIALELPSRRIELVQLEIHSSDETVIHVLEDDLLLAGDTVEDTVTYVSEADRLEVHLAELERMRRLGAGRIFPAHGSRARIETGGYGPSLIDATERYTRNLLAPVTTTDLREFVADQLADGSLEWFEPYQRVHEANLAAVASRSRPSARATARAASSPDHCSTQARRASAPRAAAVTGSDDARTSVAPSDPVIG
jgi:glyoxylase-like metal-dependent hydrolase (beta-lactamase superfamily II)